MQKYKLAIIGGGPAASAAAVYAARKNLSTAMFVGEWGGQSSVSTDIQNWIGTPHISGYDLMKSFKSHVKEYKGEYLSVIEDEYIISVNGEQGNFTVTSGRSSYTAENILVATGSHRRTLEVPGAKELEHHGLTYCASCDGPMYSGKDVVVIGGGNAGFDSALQLLAYCNSVTLLSRSAPRADEITLSKIKQNPKFTLVENAVPTKVIGEKSVSAISYVQNNNEKTIDTQAIFVEIGQLPNTDFVANLVTLTDDKHIQINPRNCRTSAIGIWAAGDCTDTLYHQNNIAAGDGVRAIEDIYLAVNK